MRFTLRPHLDFVALMLSLMACTSSRLPPTHRQPPRGGDANNPGVLLLPTTIMAVTSETAAEPISFRGNHADRPSGRTLSSKNSESRTNLSRTTLATPVEVPAAKRLRLVLQLRHRVVSAHPRKIQGLAAADQARCDHRGRQRHAIQTSPCPVRERQGQANGCFDRRRSGAGAA